MGTLTVDELAARLDRRFRVLGDSRNLGDVELRHATLQAVVVPRPRRCSPGVRGRTDDAGLDADDDVVTLGVLDALVDRSLVIAQDQEGRTRLRLLETIRQWGADRQVGGRAALADRRRVGVDAEATTAVYAAVLLGSFGLADAE